jgi:hypothetical protein
MNAKVVRFVSKISRYSGFAAAAGMLLACGLNLYVVNSRRFYTGDPRPVGEVALLAIHSVYSITSLQEEGKDTKVFALPFYGGEVIPGKYILCIDTKYAGTGSMDCVKVPLEAQTGHMYCILPKGDGSEKGMPQVVDIAAEADYAKITDAQARDWFKKNISEYQASVRRPISKSLSDKGKWE